MIRARNIIVTFAALTLMLGASSVARAQYGQPPPPPPPGYGGGYGGPAPGYPPPPPPPQGTYREGLIFGFTLGGGEIGCSDCGSKSTYGGVGLSFHIGGMITPTIAILFEGWGVSHPENNSSLTIGNATVAGRLFLGPSAWVQVGLGGGNLSIEEHDVNGNTTGSYSTDTGANFTLAGGFELFHTGNFALDLSLHAGATHIDDPFFGVFTATAVTFDVGINWY